MALVFDKELHPSGKQVSTYLLKGSNGFSIQIMDLGATWISCMVPLNSGEKREVLLRSPSIAEHVKQSAYFGAMIGRYANRIGKGRFRLANKEVQVSCNDASNSLHGGKQGWDKVFWTLENQEEHCLEFSLLSPDGDQGFPGNCRVTVRYSIECDNTVTIETKVMTDAPTVVNMTNHAYFNLDAEHSSCLSHELQLNSEEYLPVDSEGLPSEELKVVPGTGFDFVQPKKIGQDLLMDEDQRLVGGYDHSYELTKQDRDGLRKAAILTSSNGDLKMRVSTTKPALQFYSGNFLGDTPGASGVNYPKHAGLCLEPHFHPNSPNHSSRSKQTRLEPAQVYRHCSMYEFFS
ncbi:galactose-1-epimerase [Vibrio cholerae]